MPHPAPGSTAALVIPSIDAWMASVYCRLPLGDADAAIEASADLWERSGEPEIAKATRTALKATIEAGGGPA